MGISVYLFAHDVNILDIQHQHVQESFSKQKTRSNLANLSQSYLWTYFHVNVETAELWVGSTICGELA